jgi:hypothetical protein
MAGVVRACPGHHRLADSPEDVDARDKREYEKVHWDLLSVS